MAIPTLPPVKSENKIRLGTRLIPSMIDITAMETIMPYIA